MMGTTIAGIADLLEHVSCPIHVQRDEVPWVTRTTGVSEHDLVAHDSGDTVTVGELAIELVHTPGPHARQPVLPRRRQARLGRHAVPRRLRAHRPAGQRSRADDREPQAPVTVDDDVILYPGHRYSLASSATMAAVKQSNYVFESLLAPVSSSGYAVRRRGRRGGRRSFASRPSRRSITGSQPRTSRASEMSGRRTAGSSAGNGTLIDRRARAGELEHELGELAHRDLVRVADVDRRVESDRRATPAAR